MIYLGRRWSHSEACPFISRGEPHGSGVFVLRARMAGVTPRGLPPGRAQGRVEGLVNAFERIQQGLAPDEVRLRAPGGPGEQVWSGHSRSERPRGRGRPSAGHFSARAARSWWGSSGRAAPFCRRRPLHIPRLKPPGVVHGPGGVPEKCISTLHARAALAAHTLPASARLPFVHLTSTISSG